MMFSLSCPPAWVNRELLSAKKLPRRFMGLIHWKNTLMADHQRMFSGARYHS